jgi:predicted histone-like DNA-binding protein
MKTGKIKCRISKRNIVSGSVQVQDGLRVTIETPSVRTTKEMANDICHATSLTQADFQSALTSLGHVLAESLAIGQTVELDGIGSFSLNIGTQEPKRTTEKLKATDICIKGITFRPSKSLMQQLADVKFVCDQDISAPSSDEDLPDMLRIYFSDPSHGNVITVRRFAALCNCSETTARRRIKTLVEQHILELSPFAPRCYVAGEAL